VRCDPFDGVVNLRLNYSCSREGCWSRRRCSHLSHSHAIELPCTQQPCGPPKAQATLVPALMNLARWMNPEGFLRHPVTKATASPHMYVATSYPATCLPPSLQRPICSPLHLRHSTRHCLFFYLLLCCLRVFFPYPTRAPLQEEAGFSSY
jgi:hypothetical protein